MAGKKIHYITIVIESNDDGYLACCPDIQGAFAEGDTIEGAIFNCIDVFKLIAEYRTERGEPLGVNGVEFSPETRLSVAVPVDIS